MTTRREHYGWARLLCGAVLLVFWGLLIGGVPVAAQSPRHRVAVLTPGGAFSPALEGSREGLAQLGYHEGKSLTFP
jgi:hypothetical protein